MGHIVVFNYQKEGQRVWTGLRWSAEASDAEEYEDEEDGCAALRAVAAKDLLHDGEAALVRDYGLESETVVERSGAGW